MNRATQGSHRLDITGNLGKSVFYYSLVQQGLSTFFVEQPSHVETVVLLSREKVDGYVSVDLDANKIVSKSKTGFATYKEIEEYINDKYGFTVSSLNIAQVKDKCGLDKRNNYNKGKEGHKVPACPKKKEKALLEAFKHFGLIQNLIF